jgi:two-component system, OmpR family, sensor kinase
MRSMFFKLFLGFWLTMVLGGAVSVVAIYTSQHVSIELFKSDMTRKFDENTARLIVLSGQAAREMYRCGGPAEYENYISELVEGVRTRITLVRDDNRTLTGDKISDEFVHLAENARKQTEVTLKKSGETLTVAKHLTSPNGDSVVVLGVHTFGPPPGIQPPFEGKGWPFFAGILPPFFVRGEIIRITTMLAVLSGFCYIAARSLTTSIRRLQKTTQQIAGGDYSVRVGKSLGRTGNEIADLGRDFDIMVDRTEKVISAQTRLLRDISH